MSQTMTVKELANVAGVSARTVRRIAKGLGYEAQNGVETQYNAEQSIRIIGAMRVKGDRQIQAGQNGQQAGQNGQPMALTVSDIKDIIQSTVQSTVAGMLPIFREMMRETRAVPAELPAPSFMTIAGYCGEKRIRCDGESAKRWGRMAKHLSDEHGYEIQSVPDARWGSVNAYHVNVLREVVGQ